MYCHILALTIFLIGYNKLWPNLVRGEQKVPFWVFRLSQSGKKYLLLLRISVVDAFANEHMWTEQEKKPLCTFLTHSIFLQTKDSLAREVGRILIPCCFI